MALGFSLSGRQRNLGRSPPYSPRRCCSATDGFAGNDKWFCLKRVVQRAGGRLNLVFLGLVQKFGEQAYEGDELHRPLRIVLHELVGLRP